MIHTTPPARETWHQVPPGEIHYGTFTEVWGFEFRPGFAFRCGDCPWTGAGYGTPEDAGQAALRHQWTQHPSGSLVALPPTDRSLAIAVARTPDDLLKIDAPR